LVLLSRVGERLIRSPLGGLRPSSLMVVQARSEAAKTLRRRSLLRQETVRLRFAGPGSFGRRQQWASLAISQADQPRERELESEWEAERQTARRRRPAVPISEMNRAISAPRIR